MKVIKSGDGRKGWSRECTCTGEGNQTKGCGAVLLVEQGDLFLTTSQARDEETKYVTFKCPECEALTDVAGVPLHVQIKLEVRNPR